MGEGEGAGMRVRTTVSFTDSVGGSWQASGRNGSRDAPRLVPVPDGSTTTLHSEAKVSPVSMAYAASAMLYAATTEPSRKRSRSATSRDTGSANRAWTTSLVAEVQPSVTFLVCDSLREHGPPDCDALATEMARTRTKGGATVSGRPIGEVLMQNTSDWRAVEFDDG